VRHGHETLLPWQLLSVFFLKAEKEEERSPVDLQPRLHKTQEKMNESSDLSQELMKKRKQRNLKNNNDKLSHAWPRDPQQK
jgi:hypothetical protein